MSGLIGIYNSDGIGLSTNLLDLFGLKLHIPSPSYELITETVDGRGGMIVLDKKLNPRSITAEFFTKSGNYEESLRLRDELYSILKGEIYVSETYLPGKRWKVYVQGWSPDRINSRVLQFEIPLIAPSGLSESINIIEQRYNSTTFIFRNDGNEPINPREHTETEIIFKGPSNNLTIKNLTTGDEWKYTGSTVANDEILLKGIRSFKNGLSIFRNTNKKIITFAPGNNEFNISGATGAFELTIRTRFYFL